MVEHIDFQQHELPGSFPEGAFDLVSAQFLHSTIELDRSAILEEVWGVTYEGTTRTLDQHIAKLRQKIEDDPSDPRHIITCHTVGYKFKAK